MNPSLFQIIALCGLAVLVVVTVLGTVRGSIGRRDAVLWLSIWIAAGVAIAWPKLTAKIARLLGIGRGTDLVLYCAVVIMLVGFLMVYARLRQLRRELTLVVRHVAIENAFRAKPPTAPSEPNTTVAATPDPPRNG